MADINVKQLSKAIKIDLDNLLTQMKAAGLSHKSEKDIATKNFISKSVDGIVDGVSRLKQLSILKNLAENFMSRYASKRTS